MEVEKETAESVPGGAALKSCQGCRSRREGEGGGNKVNIGMGIRRQELILFHDKVRENGIAMSEEWTEF